MAYSSSVEGYTWILKLCETLDIVPIFKRNFSNSLRIHEEKTNEITAMKEVGKCGLNYHKIRFTNFCIEFLQELINGLRSHIHPTSKHLKVG